MIWVGWVWSELLVRPRLRPWEAAWFLVDNSQLQAKSFGAEPYSESWKVKHLKRWFFQNVQHCFFGEDSHFDAYCSNVLETAIFITWSLGVFKWSIALMFYRGVGPVLYSPQLCQVPRIASKSTIEMGLGMWIGMPKEPPTSDVYLRKGYINPSTLYYR